MKIPGIFHRILVGFFLFFTVVSTPIFAQQIAIDSGLIYLQTTQSLDGSWGGTPTSLNTILQTTSTTARTFQLLGSTDPALTNGISFLSTQIPNTVDDLAQQLEVLAVSGGSVTNLVHTLKTAQQTDGGIGNFFLRSLGTSLDQAIP